MSRISYLAHQAVQLYLSIRNPFDPELVFTITENTADPEDYVIIDGSILTHRNRAFSKYVRSVWHDTEQPELPHGNLRIKAGYVYLDHADSLRTITGTGDAYYLLLELALDLINTYAEAVRRYTETQQALNDLAGAAGPDARDDEPAWVNDALMFVLNTRAELNDLNADHENLVTSLTGPGEPV